MSDPDKVNDILTSGAHYNHSSFAASINRIMTEFMMVVITPWVVSCFEKYDEPFFHQKMKDGFNFIEDWRTNHPEKYNTFIKKGRKLRHFFKIDENDIMNKVDKLLQTKGWTLYPEEKEQIKEQIKTLKFEIYH